MVQEMESTSIINNKWVATVASLWIQCTSGSLYTFGIYSSALKSSQGYDQSTLDAVSVFKDFGANVGLLSGVLYSSVTPPISTPAAAVGCGGPWVVLLAGAVQCFLGYFLMWLCVAGVAPRPPFLVMCLYMVLAAHAQTFFNTANVVTAVRNFPNYSGTIVGIMKGCIGLSGALLIQVYYTIFKNNPTSYLLMLSLLPMFNTLLLMTTVRIFDTNLVDEKKYLNCFSMVTVVIAAYLMAVIILEEAVTLSSYMHIIVLVLLLLLLASPLCIAIKAHRHSLWISTASLIERNQLIYGQNQLEAGNICRRLDHGVYHQVPGGDDQQPNMTSHENMQWQDNLNLLQAISTINFWLLFLTTACGMGSGLATVNNISQIGASLGYTNFETSTLVSLWSIWNFLGRFGAGYVSDSLLHAKGWARPLFIVITLASMSIGHAMIASGFPGALYAGSVLVGVSYGSQWSLMPIIASEIFGVSHFGTIFNTITVAGPIGSYGLSVWVVGYIYDMEASAEGNTCTGSHCFGLSFFIMASTTFLGALAALGLFFRTRKFYRQVLIRRLQHSSREQKD